MGLREDFIKIVELESFGIELLDALLASTRIDGHIEHLEEINAADKAALREVPE
jgi:hypothetical protein